MKRILVTGGAGFIGSHLCKRLLAQGHSVIALDNLSTGTKRGIEDIVGHERFTFIEQDVIKPIDVAVDWILNFACPASPPRYQEDPIQTTKTSVLGMLNMLELAKKYNARIMQASTSEVYGDPKVHPQVESYRGDVNPIGIRACYDEGKRCAETLCFDYQRRFDIDIKIIRIFNTYGPFMDPLDGRVVSNFIMRALEGNSLEIYGDGKQTRSFCYVDDLVEGILNMMETPKGVYGPVNLGNPAEYKIIDLAHMILELTKSSSTLVYKPLPQDDPLQRCPDISRAYELFGWQPQVDVKNGLRTTITYFDRLISQAHQHCRSDQTHVAL